MYVFKIECLFLFSSEIIAIFRNIVLKKVAVGYWQMYIGEILLFIIRLKTLILKVNYITAYIYLLEIVYGLLFY